MEWWQILILIIACGLFADDLTVKICNTVYKVKTYNKSGGDHTYGCFVPGASTTESHQQSSDL